MNALEMQVGGNHYKDMKIQPIVYCMENNLGVCESNIVKYVSRYKNKNGVEDLKKAKQYLEILIESVEKVKYMRNILKNTYIAVLIAFATYGIFYMLKYAYVNSIEYESGKYYYRTKEIKWNQH